MPDLASSCPMRCGLTGVAVRRLFRAVRLDHHFSAASLFASRPLSCLKPRSWLAADVVCKVQYRPANWDSGDLSCRVNLEPSFRACCSQTEPPARIAACAVLPTTLLV